MLMENGRKEAESTNIFKFMAKLGTKSYYKRKADTIFSKIIRSYGKCEMCGRSDEVQLHCAHFIGRNNHTLRWDYLNAICLCAGCHRGAHDDPQNFVEWFKRQYPSRYMYVSHNKNQLTKRTALDYKELVELLEERYKKCLKQ